MSRDFYTLEELAVQLGQDRRVVEKQVSRGHIPGRRVGGEWRFNKTEISDWLEHQIRSLDEPDLAILERSQQSPEVTERSPVGNLLQLDLVQVPLNGKTRGSVMRELVEVAGRTWQVFDAAAILEAVLQREEVGSTAFPGGVAIPHPQNRMPDAIGEPLIAFGKAQRGIPFGGPYLIDMFFLVLARDPNTHLKVLARLSRLFQAEDFLDDLRETTDSESAYNFILEADAKLDVPE
ncbi:MAG: PTS sugar transporter subunit IIA [Planctomycetaceae bacterium]